MDSRDYLEDHVSRLTKLCRTMTNEIAALETRLTYFENIVATLLIALKSAGVIQDDPDGDHSFD